MKEFQIMSSDTPQIEFPVAEIHTDNFLTNPVKPMKTEASIIVADSQQMFTASQVEPSDENKQIDDTEPTSSGLSQITKRYRPSVASQRTTKKRHLESINMVGPELTPREDAMLEVIRKQNQKICDMLEKLQTAKNALAELSTGNYDLLLNPTSLPVLRQLVLCHLRSNSRLVHSQRWTLEEKLNATAIYKRGSKAYAYLQHLMDLSSVRTISRVSTKLQMGTGINPQIMNHLAMSVAKMEPKDRNCIVMFDEMTLKQRLEYNEKKGNVDGFEDFGTHGRTSNIADHALVFMAQGLGKRWKQPIAYYFCKGTTTTVLLQKLILDVLEALQSIGMQTAAVVCDQGSRNRGALQELQKRTSTDQPGPYFIFDDHRVYTLYNPPHLFKSLRNNFMGNFDRWVRENRGVSKFDYPGNIIKWNEKVAQWQHIVKMLKMDAEIFHFNKLSDNHVFPRSKGKTRVTYAAKTLSNTTAAILRCIAYSSNEELLSGCHDTSQVIQDLDDLFDVMNGPENVKDVKKNKRTNVTTTSFHVEKWAHFRKIINEMVFVRYTGESYRPPCQDGFVTTLLAMQDLWQYLREKVGFTSLRLRQLNKDPLENLFRVIRKHGVTNANPTCSHFEAAIKASIVTRLSGPHSENENCERDSSTMLSGLRELLMAPDECAAVLESKDVEEHHQEKYVREIGDITDNDNVINIPEVGGVNVAMSKELSTLSLNESVQYVARSIVRCLASYVTACDHCRSSLISSDMDVDGIATGSPSADLINFVTMALQYLREKVIANLHDRNLHEVCRTELLVSCDTTFMRCGAHGKFLSKSTIDFVIKLMVMEQCCSTNRKYKQDEENSGNAAKIAQQAGCAQ